MSRASSEDLLLPSRYLVAAQETHRHSVQARRSIGVLQSFKDEAWDLYKHAEAERAMMTKERLDRGQQYQSASKRKKKGNRNRDGKMKLFPAVASVPRIDSNWPVGPAWRGEKDSLLDPFLPPKISVPVTVPVSSDGHSAAISGDEDVFQDGESSHHWRYHTTRADIAILSRSRRAISLQDMHIDGQNHHATTPQESINRRIHTRNELPIFRGEGTLLKDYRLEDISFGVIRSFGARAIWDSNLFSDISVLEIFNDTDQLLHGFTKGTELVSARDYCAVMSMAIADDEKTAYISTSSTEDALAPEKYSSSIIRSQIDLSGWILQKRMIDLDSTDHPNGNGHSEVNENGTSGKSARQVNGIHMSYVIQSDPRGSIPQTFLNQLSLSLPLCLASVINYINRWGFAPYLLRRGIKRRQPTLHGDPVRSYENSVRIQSESWEHKSATYNVIFCVYKHQALTTSNQDQQINGQHPVAEEYSVVRFTAPTFGSTGYEVSVKNASGWYIIHDSDEGNSGGPSDRCPASSLVVPHSGLKSSAPVQVRLCRKIIDDGVEVDAIQRTSQAFYDTTIENMIKPPV